MGNAYIFKKILWQLEQLTIFRGVYQNFIEKNLIKRVTSTEKDLNILKIFLFWEKSGGNLIPLKP